MERKMKLEKIPMGKTGYATKLSKSEKKRLLTDWDWGADKYGQPIQRADVVMKCNCGSGKTVEVQTQDDVCVNCGYYAMAVEE